MLANNKLIKPKVAIRELARRELARRHLVDFQKYIHPWYIPGRSHIYVGGLLEQVMTFVQTKGQAGIGRLLILKPPRHGKSQQASIDFPSWFLGKLPDDQVIITSYGLDKAAEFSKKSRDIVIGDRYENVFGNRSALDIPIKLSNDSRSVKAWSLAAPYRGGMLASGVGGGMTGWGSHLLIVDDPFKNREEAESEVHRDKVWEWWTSTAYTRLEDGAAIVGMLTRWHADDWAGRLIKAMATNPKADQWKIVCLMARWELPILPEDKTFEEYRREQMLMGNWVELVDPLDRKPGEALWPEKYNEEDLERFEINVGSYDWAALYQQSPYSRQGGMFKRTWFSVVDNYPDPKDVVMRIRAWDKAGNETGIGGDYTAGVRMSITKDDVIYIEDLFFEKCTVLQREEAIARMGKLDLEIKGPRCVIWHQRDPATEGLFGAQTTNANLAKKGLTAHFEKVSGEGNKEVRAGNWSTACEGGRVRLIRAAWNEGFIERHCGFPKAKYDDDVDAASWGYGILVKNAAQVAAMDNPFYGDES